MTGRRLGLPSLIAALAVAGAAHAEVNADLQAAALAPQSTTPQSSIPVIDLSAARTAARVSYAQAAALQAAGQVQTSVDRPLASGGATASLGFLCGRQAVYEHSGVADARGFDPDGKFLGAKLAFAFK